MRKLQHIALSFCLVLSLLFYPNVEASASSVSLGVSSSNINIGDTVTVSVSVPDGITAGVDLSFSSDVLSFVSASADVGANGSVITINVGKLSLASSNTVSVTFKANTSGTASLSASPTSAVDNSTAEEVSLSGASTSITVENQVPEQPSTPPPSDTEPTPPPSGGDDTSDDETDEAPKSADNSLSTLKLSSGTLSPSFKYNVTKYTATVGYNVENVVISATPSNGKATIESVTGNGNVNLQVGENTIEIVVQAENGVKATYTIVVTREEEGGETTDDTSDDESSETDSQDTPEPEEKDFLQWNGQKLQPAENVPKDVIPADFSANTVMVNSVETPCLTFENGDLKVLYLTNEEGTSGLYVYDEAQQMVYPFVKVESNDNYVVVLVPDAGNAPAPENYKACTLSIEGKGVINAYQFVQPVVETEQTSWFGPETYYAAEPVATDFYLIYGMNNLGEKGWYVYDSVEGTIQRYLGSVHNPLVEQDVENDETAGVAEDNEKYDALKAKLKQAENTQMIILCVAIFVVIVLVIIIVNLIIRNRSDEDYDDDFDDEEDDDEYDFDEDEDTTEKVDEADDEIEIEFYEMPQEEAKTESEDDEIEIEFYEMPQEEAETESEDDEIEIEFCEMPQEKVEPESKDDEIEIEFYEMSQEEIEDDDEVEVEFYNMEELLIQEAVAPEKEASKQEEIIPEKKQTVVYAEDDDDDDLEFIELD